MDRKRENQLTWLMSLPVLGFLIFLGFMPIMFPIMSRYEGVYLPVVENVHVEEVDSTNTGLFINVRFDKIRSCEFIGISWYDSFGDRLPILFEIEAEGEQGEIPRTRPVLNGQISGPWKIIGLDRLDGSTAILSHRCHPLCITYTHFYP